jgi:hypothetical protein
MDEARLDVPGMAEHQREQPDDAGRVRRIREGDEEARELRERGYTGAYTAVKRFAAAIRPPEAKPYEVRPV